MGPIIIFNIYYTCVIVVQACKSEFRKLKGQNLIWLSRFRDTSGKSRTRGYFATRARAKRWFHELGVGAGFVKSRCGYHMQIEYYVVISFLLLFRWAQKEWIEVQTSDHAPKRCVHENSSVKSLHMYYFISLHILGCRCKLKSQTHILFYWKSF